MEKNSRGEGRASTSIHFQDVDVDHYDYINAPQFVDFCDLAGHDDPNVEEFFETHTEEDDFFIPIEVISPTIQELKDEDILVVNQNQVNQAASEAGMEDVKVVYYSSPSEAAKRPTLGNRTMNSDSSSLDSFYTPIGVDYGKNENDKENYIPSAHPNNKNRDSLLSKLEKLTLLSSDDEDTAVESIETSYTSPTSTPLKTDSSLLESLLKTPGAVKPKVVTAQCITGVSAEKWNFFQGISFEDAEIKSATKSVEVETENHQEVDDVFGDDIAANLDEPLPSEQEQLRKQSVLVEPHTGYEVIWGSGDATRKYPALPKRLALRAMKTKRATATVTVPQPFNFASTKPRTNTLESNDPSSSKNHAHPKGNEQPLPLIPRKRATVPQPFNLAPTKPRTTNTLESTNPASKPPFRPKRKEPVLALPPMIRKRATVPQPFNLAPTKPRTNALEAQPPVFKFKARPAPSKAPAQIAGKERARGKFTLPIAPHFATDDRIRARHENKREGTATTNTK